MQPLSILVSARASSDPIATQRCVCQCARGDGVPTETVPRAPRTPFGLLGRLGALS